MVLPNISVLNAPATFKTVEDAEGCTLASLFVIYWLVSYRGQDIEAIEIQDLHVVPTHRQQGLGRALMEHVMAENANKAVILKAEPFNDGMPVNALTDWYRRLGFRDDCPFFDDPGWLWKPPAA